MDEKKSLNNIGYEHDLRYTSGRGFIELNSDYMKTFWTTAKYFKKRFKDLDMALCSRCKRDPAASMAL